MDERINDSIENTLDFAILNVLRQGSLGSVAIERGIQRVRAILELAAARKWTVGPASPDVALQRLQKAGWIETVQPRSASSPERAYALTCEGRKQVELEWVRRESTLASFVENGALDESFRRFLLNRAKPSRG